MSVLSTEENSKELIISIKKFKNKCLKRGYN